MPGAQYAGMCLVRIDGGPLPSDVELLLANAVVDSSLHAPDAFLLRFRDPDRVVLRKAGITIGSAVEILVDNAEPGAPRGLFVGEATALEVDVDGEGTFTVVRGYDRTHRLRGQRRASAYRDMSDGQIVAAVLRKAGLAAGTIARTGVVHRHVAQAGQDDWAFLQRLARRAGVQLTASDGKVHFGPPHRPGGSTYVLEPGDDVLSLRASVNGAGQATSVTTTGWDREAKRSLRANQAVSTGNSTLSGADTPAGAARALGYGERVETYDVWMQQAEVQQAAAGTAGRVADHFAGIDAVLRGEPTLLAGRSMDVANLGAPFDGSYTLTRVRHVFDPDTGYSTTVSVGAAEEPAAPDAGISGNGRIPGLVVGIVTDARDPRHLGRVRVKLPWLDENYVTDWAPTMQLGAGRNRGSLVLPEVDDEVLLGFQHGDFASPFVLGGLHNAVDTAPDTPASVDTSGVVTRRAFVSRDGHTLQFLDSGGTTSGGASLATGDGKLGLVLDTAGTKISVSSDGTVRIDARDGVRIASANGPVELSGTSIRLTSQGAVEVQANTKVSVAAQGELALSGMTAALRGNGTTEVKAGGVCTVNGSLVRIN